MSKKNIKGITLEIGGNVQPLNKALEGVNKTSRDLQSELRQVDRLLKLDPKNTELLAQKQKLLGEAVSNTRDKLNTLKEAERQVQEQFKRGEVSEEQYRAIQREVIQTERNLKDLESQLNNVNNKWKTAADGLNNFGQKSTDIGKKLLPATAVITGLGAAATYAAMELEATEAKYSTVFGEFRDEADAFIKKFKELTPATTAEARNMASGIQDLLVPMGFMRGEATQLTADTMHLVGALANFNSGTHSAQDVANAFSSALTGSTEPLKRLGIQINQASMEAYALANGFVQADVDTLKLKKSLVDIEAAQIKHNEAVKKYGAESLEARTALADLELKEQARDKLMEGSKVTLDNQTKAQVLLAMAYEQSGDALEAYTEENLDAKTQMALFAKDMQDLGAEFGEVLLPILKDLLGFLRDLISRFSGMDDRTKKVIVVVGGLVAAIGPLLILIGSMATGLASIIGLFGGTTVAAGGATVATAGFGASMAAALLPILAVIAAVALVAAGVYLLIKNWDTVKEFFLNLWESIKDIFAATWEWLKDLFFRYHPIGLVIKNWDTIKEFFGDLWERVKDIFSGAMRAVAGFVIDRFLAIVSFLIGIRDRIVGIFDKVKDGILGIWDKIFSGIKGFVNRIIEVINGMIGGMNKLQWDVPNWVPIIGGKKWGVNIPRIPLMDTGGIVKGPGVFQVGPGVVEVVRRYNPAANTSQEVRHSGTIRVEGVNSKGQLVAAADMLIEGLNDPRARLALDRAQAKLRTDRLTPLGGRV